MAISKVTQKVASQLSCEGPEEEEIMLAVENFSKIAEKGDEKKTAKAKQELEKVVKKMKKVKMQDVEKAMQKAGVGPKK